MMAAYISTISDYQRDTIQQWRKGEHRHSTSNERSLSGWLKAYQFAYQILIIASQHDKVKCYSAVKSSSVVQKLTDSVDADNGTCNHLDWSDHHVHLASNPSKCQGT